MTKTSFDIDLRAVARCFAITDDDAAEWWRDGKAVALLMEMIVARQLDGIRVSGQKPWDVETYDGEKWEVRVCSRRGLHFLPNNQVGAGRKFDRTGFMQKLDAITGYAVCDVSGTGHVDVYYLPADTVLDWFARGLLGSPARLTRKDFRHFMAQTIER